MRQDNLRRLTLGDRIVVGGTLVTLVAMLLPWWDSGLGVTANGFHDWGWLTLLALAGVAMLLVVRITAADGGPRLSVDDDVAYLIGGAAEVLGSVIFWVGNNGRLVGGVRFGVFVALVGGMVTVIGGWVKRMEMRPLGPSHGGDR
ncbi:MAG TPA: hypothetical protein VGQ42_04880 [Candidatus Dormibacteraeota bacterium]|jgi:hypothetical protein|nr:hypothetical protein [Candidatus Dormibacteraeota bacterium]